MTATTQIPIEIVKLIIDQLNQDQDFTSPSTIQHALFNCSLVCRAYHHLANPLLWKTVRIYTGSAATKLLDSLEETTDHQGAQHIRNIYLHSTYCWKDAELLRLLTHIGLLEGVDIGDACFLTDWSLSQLIHQCNGIQSFRLVNSPVTLRSITRLAQCGRHQHLQQLELYHCSRLAWHTFRSLRMCPLRKLAVVGMHNWNGMDTLHLVKKAARDLTQLHYLTDLEISHVSTEFVKKLTTTAAWAHLTCFRLLGGIVKGDDDDVMMVDTDNDDFEIDDFEIDDEEEDGNDDGAMVTVDSCMIRFIQSHRGLTKLILVGIGISDVTLEAIAFGLSSTLRYLDISDNELVTEAGIRHVVVDCLFLCCIILEECGHSADAFPMLVGARYHLSANNMKIDNLDQDAINLIRNSGAW